MFNAINENQRKINLNTAIISDRENWKCKSATIIDKQV